MNKKQIQFLDKARIALAPGDLVVYGVAYGSRVGLSYGCVLGVLNGKLKVAGVDKPYDSVEVKKPGFLKFSENVLKITRESVPSEILFFLDEVEYTVS
jgi:hypothetical protein